MTEDISDSSSEESMGILGAAWRYKWLCLVIVLLCVALSAGIGLLGMKGPTATATMALTNPRSNNVLTPGVSGDSSLARFTAQQADFLLSDEVLSRVVDQIPSKTLSELRDDVVVSASSASNTVTITATAASAQAAVTLTEALLNAYREAILDAVAERTDSVLTSIGDDIERITTEAADQASSSPQAQAAAQSIAELRGTASDIKTDSTAYGDGVDWTTFDTIDDVQVATVPLREMAIGLVVGLGLAAVVAWILADRRREIRNGNRASGVLAAPSLGLVGPRGRRGDAEGDSRFVAPAVALRGRIAGGAILVVGVGESADTADAARGLAHGLALQNCRGVVVDADFGGPDPQGEKQEGFAELVAGSHDLSELRVRADESDQGFDLLGRGARTDVSTLSSEARVRHALAELLVGDDYVLLDGGHFDAHPVSSILAANCDGMVVVVPYGTRESELSWLRDLSSSLGASLLGFVFMTNRSRG